MDAEERHGIRLPAALPDSVRGVCDRAGGRGDVLQPDQLQHDPARPVRGHQQLFPADPGR